MEKIKYREIKTISTKEELIKLVKDKTGEITVFDGISGTGKTFLINLLLKHFGIDEDIAEKQNGKFGIDTDIFLGQDTDNFEEVDFSKRSEIISSLLNKNNTTKELVEKLKKVYRNEKHLSRVLHNILYALDNNILSFTKKGLFLYNRGERRIEKGRIEIEIKDALSYLIGGTNVSEVAKKTSRKINTILLYSDPQISLLNALYRDFGKGKLDGIKRFNFRLQETFGLAEIQKQNLDKGYIDYLFKDETVFEVMLNKYKEQNNICETGDCLSDFMRKIEEIFTKTENTDFYSEIKNKEFIKFKDAFWNKSRAIARKYFPNEKLNLELKI